jgi:hypothetical protein
VNDESHAPLDVPSPEPISTRHLNAQRSSWAYDVPLSSAFAESPPLLCASFNPLLPPLITPPPVLQLVVIGLAMQTFVPLSRC